MQCPFNVKVLNLSYMKYSCSPTCAFSVGLSPYACKGIRIEGCIFGPSWRRCDRVAKTPLYLVWCSELDCGLSRCLLFATCEVDGALMQPITSIVSKVIQSRHGLLSSNVLSQKSVFSERRRLLSIYMHCQQYVCFDLRPRSKTLAVSLVGSSSLVSTWSCAETTRASTTETIRSARKESSQAEQEHYFNGSML